MWQHRADERGSPDPQAEQSNAEDRQRMQRLALGDSSALDELIGKYWHSIVRYAAHITGSVETGEDVAQETFLAVWRRRADWKSITTPRVYLYGISRNLALKEIRRHAVRDRWSDQIARQVRAVRTPLEHSEQEELRAAFERALQHLPPRRREAFVLVRFDGLTLSEAAKVMDISTQTVANQVTAALADLRVLLTDFAG